MFFDLVLVRAMLDLKRQDSFLWRTLSSKCRLRSISSLVHLIVSRRATGSGMTVPYQLLRHNQLPWQVSLVGLTPCCTNHRTIKAEHLGVQNKVVQAQSMFSSTCHHSLRMSLVHWNVVWLCLYQRQVTDLLTGKTQRVCPSRGLSTATLGV